MVRVAIFSLLIFISTMSNVYAKVYEIVEPDFIETAKIYTQTDEFKRFVEERVEDNIKKFKELKGVELPKSDRDYSYEVTYTYTLPEDMPKVDKEGNIIGILYPKGYTFEPLKYMRNPPPPVIVYNPCDDNERVFLNNLKSEFDKSYQRYIILTSGCSISDIQKKKVTHPIYLLDEKMAKMLNLKNTVSVVKADLIKGVFQVYVYKTDKNN